MAKHIQMPPIYPIPKNWTWVELRGLTQIISGYPFNSKLFSNLPEEGRPLIRIRDVVRGYTETFTSETCTEQYIVHKNDILIGMDGDFNVGKWQDEDALLNQRVCRIQSVSNLLLNDYLFYFLPKPLKQINDVTPSVTVKHLSIKTIESIMIPLPPVDEQQRLISLIKSLFNKLDEAKEKAQEVIEGFENRRAAILCKAFSGELTAKWRANRDISDLWTTNKLSDVANLQTGLMKGKKFNGDTVFMPYLRVANVQDGYLDLNEIKTIEVSTTNYERYLLRKGDVLFTEGGDYDKLGRGTVWNDEIPNCLHQNHIFVVRVDTNSLLPAFLSYQAGSQYGKKYFMSCAKQTTNLASINSTQLKNFPVVMPSLDEQHEIVRILDSVFAKEKQAKEVAEMVLEQIDMLKKSLLAHVFHGKLNTKQ